MVIGLDSAYAPSSAQAQAARAAGISVWSGYLASHANVGLYHPWTQADFELARLCGGTPIAYCSGNDDPVACKALATAWNVRLCLDVENGIRGDGPWVQGWLDASGAGLYGVAAAHLNRRAPFHILAWYLNQDPGTTWPTGVDRPAGPLGWQWHNSHNEFGTTVDRCWLDDYFGQGEDMTPEEHDRQKAIENYVGQMFRLDPAGGSPLVKAILDIQDRLGKLGQPGVPSGTKMDATITVK